MLSGCCVRCGKESSVEQVGINIGMERRKDLCHLWEGSGGSVLISYPVTLKY